MEVKDIYKSKECYEAWKSEAKNNRIRNLSTTNSKLVLEYISDMEAGRNTIRKKKGARGYLRLNTLRNRIPLILTWFEEHGYKDIRKLNEKECTKLFNDMREGRILNANGKVYTSVNDYVKDFRAFWNWIIRTQSTCNKPMQDVTINSSTEKTENNFVHFTKEELEKCLPYFTENEQVMLRFMLDTIIRSPSELANVRVSDLSEVDA